MNRYGNINNVATSFNELNINATTKVIKLAVHTASSVSTFAFNAIVKIINKTIVKKRRIDHQILHLQITLYHKMSVRLLGY